VYGDASRWKLIARANGISNPRTVRPGTIVTIPKLEPGR
jgi:nucleoid-associated protein YgaU